MTTDTGRMAALAGGGWTVAQAGLAAARRPDMAMPLAGWENYVTHEAQAVQGQKIVDDLIRRAPDFAQDPVASKSKYGFAQPEDAPASTAPNCGLTQPDDEPAAQPPRSLSAAARPRRSLVRTRTKIPTGIRAEADHSAARRGAAGCEISRIVSASVPKAGSVGQ